MASRRLVDGDVVVVAGDSITDAAKDTAPPLGLGYLRLVAEAVDDADDKRHVSWVNSGIGGHTVEDLAARWERDVLSHRPSWLVVYIGINDLYFRVAGDSDHDASTYEATYRRLLAAAAAASSPEVVLVEPFFAAAADDPDPYRQQMLAGIGEYVAAVRRIAADTDATTVPLHDLFAARIESGATPTDLAPDAVHPTDVGSRLITDAVLTALGERPD